ncbi:uncharacterized protein G2W53_025509 [Senna tora]|uniref:Uncharacterized protein n=1 Tax=Senna tora TaxID=362788 RepID=A0A834WKC1_9FABA|nr:uncharacterized protein G2W53_025509 [Senna tora]
MVGDEEEVPQKQDDSLWFLRLS